MALVFMEGLYNWSGISNGGTESSVWGIGSVGKGSNFRLGVVDWF